MTTVEQRYYTHRFYAQLWYSAAPLWIPKMEKCANFPPNLRATDSEILTAAFSLSLLGMFASTQ